MLTEVNVSLYSKNGKSKLNIFLNIIIAVIIVALALEIIFAANYSGIYVVGPSMNPTLTGAQSETSEGGDYVYVNKYAKPTYGDIVVVFKEDNTTIIKRVVALGGDYVKLDRGKLLIKKAGQSEFEEIAEDYVLETNNDPERTVNNFCNDEEGYFVEEDSIFLLGDNRNVSVDSRARGSFKLTQLYGVVTSWSLKNKSFFTRMHKYFYFDLPQQFGLRK